VISTFLKSRLFHALLAISMVIAFLMWHAEPSDPRPVGSLDDLARLKDRDDINVLFILIDTLRADRLGSYGYERDTSPTLDRLAETGIRFKNHVSQCSWTKSSMASIWTGLYPSHTGVHRYSHAIPEEARMPAEVFRDAGFRTEGIWRNGWVAPNFGFSQGFDTYVRPISVGLAPKIRHAHPGATLSGSDVDATRAAIEFLRTVRENERWFLYLHFMDVHQYVSDLESARFGTDYSDLYDNAIHWTDRNIELLLDDLRSRELLDKTIIVVASDHGEAFREHESEGHARNLYGEVIDTPFIISLPFKLEAPLVVESPSGNVDVWPTIFELLDLPGFEAADGESLVPAIESARKGMVSNPSRPIFSDLNTGWGNPKAPSKRIVTLTRGSVRSHDLKEMGFEVYDLEADPTEQVDLAEANPDLTDDLRSEIDAYLADDERPWNPQDVELDDLMLNQLRALGYEIK
jgi:arylsulfatase A-like enzyme